MDQSKTSQFFAMTDMAIFLKFQSCRPSQLVPFWSRTRVEKIMASSKKANYKGRSPNVIRYVQSCGSEVDISGLIAPNLAAGARLAAENQSQALDEKTARTYELRLIALENFATANGDDAILFGPDKRPFLAATIQTYMRKFFFLDIFT